MKKPARAVVQCDMKGSIIKKFPSLYQACKELGIKDSAAYYALNSGSPYAGKWRFKYADEAKTTTKPPDPSEELKSSIDFKPTTEESYDGDPLLDPTIDEPAMWASPDQESVAVEPDRFLTPYERILARRK
jgi:hypothetical protein